MNIFGGKTKKRLADAKLLRKPLLLFGEFSADSEQEPLFWQSFLALKFELKLTSNSPGLACLRLEKFDLHSHFPCRTNSAREHQLVIDPKCQAVLYFNFWLFSFRLNYVQNQQQEKVVHTPRRVFFCICCGWFRSCWPDRILAAYKNFLWARDHQSTTKESSKPSVSIWKGALLVTPWGNGLPTDDFTMGLHVRMKWT